MDKNQNHMHYIWRIAKTIGIEFQCIEQRTKHLQYCLDET
jgi:hypothetical protein